MNHSVLRLLIAGFAMSYASCGDDSSSSGSGDDPTVVAGAQPDGQTGRYTAPPDTTPPTKLKAFSVAMGDRLGEIMAVFGYPDATDDYARIDLRRAAGAVEPADCAGGTLVASITDFSTPIYVDTGLFPGTYHSYLACLYDEKDNLVAEKSLSTGRANDRQRMFVTSATYDGNLKADFQGKSFATGKEGGDARCQYHADQAGLGGKWAAILGVAGSSGRRVAPIYNGVYSLGGQRVTANSNLWTSGVENAVKYDEKATAVDAATRTWGGLDYDGVVMGLYTCSEWSSTSGSGQYGHPSAEPSATNSDDWVEYSSAACSEKKALYCLDKVDVDVSAPTLTATVATLTPTVTVNVTVDFGTVSASTASVVLYRDVGATLVNPDCSWSYDARRETVATYTGAEDAPFADDNDITDVVDYDGLTTEHGRYTYYTCVTDAYGNVVKQSSTSLTVGTDFLRAFISSTALTATGATIAGGNTECASSASAAGLTGTFKALLSTATTNAKTNIGQTNTRLIFDLLGNYAGYVSPTSFSTANGILQSGASATALPYGTFVWTGSYYDGTVAPSNCSNWTSTSSGVYGYIGMVQGIASDWAEYSYTSCNGSYRIACIEAN